MGLNRAAIFIDGSNFYNGAKRNNFSPRVDYFIFSEQVAKGYNLIRTYYYSAPLIQKYDQQGYKNQQKFFDALRRTKSLTLKLGRLERRDDTYIEKGVDTQIAVDLLSMAYKNAYDVAIMVTADADFVPAVEEVKSLGKRVLNAYFQKGVSYHLRQACDDFILINKSMMEQSARKG